MNIISRQTLNDGSMLDIVRIILPEEVPTAMPWMQEEARRDLPSCWGNYYDKSFSGENPGCRDFLYFGLVDGVCVARMWFGYSIRTKIGNFGNVQTLPEYRRRGIMGALLRCCIADFHASGILSVSCDAADAAAPAYAAFGFKRIFTPDKPPMALTADGGAGFHELIRLAYASGQTAACRPGMVADRFDCDKLLAYCPEIYGKMTLPKEIPDYLTLWSRRETETLSVRVLEAASGFVAGYAFVYQGIPYAVIHPHFEAYRVKFLVNK